jgi:chromosome segregation ATPase
MEPLAPDTLELMRGLRTRTAAAVDAAQHVEDAAYLFISTANADFEATDATHKKAKQALDAAKAAAEAAKSAVDTAQAAIEAVNAEQKSMELKLQETKASSQEKNKELEEAKATFGQLKEALKDKWTELGLEILFKSESTVSEGEEAPELSEEHYKVPPVEELANMTDEQQGLHETTMQASL